MWGALAGWGMGRVGGIGYGCVGRMGYEVCWRKVLLASSGIGVLVGLPDDEIDLRGIGTEYLGRDGMG